MTRHILPVKKNNNREFPTVIPDCVPIAIYECLNRNILYSNVLSQCFKEDSDWIYTGGVELCHIASIMRNVGCGNVLTLNTPPVIRNYYDSQITNINAILVYDAYPKEHAVNAYRYDGSNLTKKVFYNDNKNLRFNKWMSAFNINTLFVCQ